jgi:sulfur-oxidizing protein SoxX
MRRATVLGALALAVAIPAWPQRAPTAVELFVSPAKGRCIACHQLPAGSGPATTSDLGPKLEGARMRALGKAGIRAAIVDPTVANPDTVMPPYGRHRILDAKEIDQLVDYLNALP